MKVSMDSSGDQVRMSLVGNIDEGGADDMKKRFHEQDLSRIKQLTIDFSGVTFIGSAGIGKLLLFYKNLAAHGGQINLVNMPADIYDTFHTLKLGGLFNLSK